MGYNDNKFYYDEDGANSSYREHRANTPWKPRARSRKGDELEGGTVIPCNVCKFAYYSIYGYKRPYNKTGDSVSILPPVEKQVCERCRRNALYNKNVQAIKDQQL